MLGIVEREIDKSIVDKIDRFSLAQQSTVLVLKLSSVGNHRLYPMLLDQPPGQKELRIKVLFLRPVIDDCDPPRRPGPMLELPLMLKHAHDRQLKIVGLGFAHSDLYLGAAGLLGFCQQRIQEGAARVRIDLDELGSIRGNMKVVTHENATRSKIMPRNLGSAGQSRGSIARQSGRGLDRVHDPKHRGDVGF